MNKSQQRHFDRLRRVAGFGSNHQKDFTAASKARTLFGEVQAVVSEIETTTRKPRGRRPSTGETSDKQQAFTLLRNALERIEATARVIEQENPEFAGKFQVPDKRRKNELASAARQFIADAEPVKDEFWAYEVPRSFLKDLASHLELYSKAKETPAKPVAARATADSGIKGSISRGQDLVSTLNVIVNNKYGASPETLKEWAAANDLEFTPRKRRSSKSATIAA